MTKYRIIKIKGSNLLCEDYFEVQFKKWFIWQELNSHGTLHSAKRCVDNMRLGESIKKYEVINY